MPHRISQLIKLDKPLVIFDVETTGLSISSDRIIEIAYSKVMPNGVVFKDDVILNPEMSIPREVSEMHGLTDEDVADKPTFKEKAQDIWEVFQDCYYGGFNVINFDLPLLRREFLRTGRDFSYSQKDIIDSKVIFNYMEPRTLSAAYRYYCGREHNEAHIASGDVMVTAEILIKQLEKYQEIRDWDFVHRIHQASFDRYVDNERKFYWRNGEAYFAFSKYKDQPLKEVVAKDPGFLEWMLGADFSLETKNIVKEALSGKSANLNLWPQRKNQE